MYQHRPSVLPCEGGWLAHRPSVLGRMACASSQREGGRIGQGGRIHYFNYSFGYQDTKVRALGGDIIIGIICVLRQ